MPPSRANMNSPDGRGHGRGGNHHHVKPVGARGAGRASSPTIERLKRGEKEEPPLSGADAAKAKAAFLAADADGSGNLDPDELIAVLKSLGHDVTVTRMRELIEPYDLNSDGALDLNEFMLLISAHGGTDKNKSRDELDAEALLDCIWVPDDGLGAPLDPPSDERKRPDSAQERIPAEKIKELERRLATDFDLSVSITDVIDGPITDEKIRSFLLDVAPEGMQ